MGEGRGKLEVLIADLEAKKTELERLIQEYEVMLPHLANARSALDEAGITDTGPAAEAPAPAAAPAAAAKPAKEEAKKEEAAAPAEAKKEEAPAEQGEPKPARRSIASLVAEDEAAGDEATH